MMESIGKAEEKKKLQLNLSNKESVGSEKSSRGYATSPLLCRGSLQKKFIKYIMKEGSKGFTKQKYYKGMVSSRINQPSQSYERWCQSCKADSKFNSHAIE